MANARIDANDLPTLVAYNDATGLCEPVRVDPVFGYVEVFAVPYVADVPGTLSVARIDANENATLLAYNETTGLPEAVRCGPNGEILIIAQ